MLCSPQHIFKTGDRISFEIKAVPDKFAEPTRSSNGRPFPVRTTEVSDDGKTKMMMYRVVSARMCSPDEVPNRGRSIIGRSPLTTSIPFDYQQLIVHPFGYDVECHPSQLHGQSTIWDIGRRLNPDCSKRYSSIPWFLDTTTMAVRHDADGSASHTIEKIWLYDSPQQSVYRITAIGDTALIAHCPCEACCNHFDKYGMRHYDLGAFQTALLECAEIERAKKQKPMAEIEYSNQHLIDEARTLRKQFDSGIDLGWGNIDTPVVFGCGVSTPEKKFWIEDSEDLNSSDGEILKQIQAINKDLLNRFLEPDSDIMAPVFDHLVEIIEILK